ncbi:MAG: DoxX family protein [Chloroflexi bacterium RBG_13_68_17]|nr:MAG: DoxX family protein [Chloroflexi bacterium RBG_13_68_17]
MASERVRRGRVIQDPPVVQRLLNDPRAGLLWLPLRLWLGWQWLHSGWGKLINPAWTQTGEALRGFWVGAVVLPEAGRPAIAFDWYRSFVQVMVDAQAWTWFSKLVVAGELLVGVTLVLGAFTGIAAFLGGFMNWNFMMAGSASVNPVFFVLSVGLILAWKVSGYFGLDYFLLPRLGTPWTHRAADSAKAGPSD